MQPQQPHTHQGPRSTPLPHPGTRPLPLPLPLLALPSPLPLPEPWPSPSGAQPQPRPAQARQEQGSQSGHRGTKTEVALDPALTTSPLVSPSVLYGRKGPGSWLRRSGFQSQPHHRTAVWPCLGLGPLGCGGRRLTPASPGAGDRNGAEVSCLFIPLPPPGAHRAGRTVGAR